MLPFTQRNDYFCCLVYPGQTLKLNMSRSCYLFFLWLFLIPNLKMAGQACTTLGQTPSTAFPVCGTSVFTQSNVPLCATNDIYVPGCSGSGNANYQNKNPFFYRFTCYTAGTLGFVITPLANDEDYDWQLYDITGHNPEDIFTVNSLVVTGNWAGTYGPTGASSAGVANIQCGSSPSENKPTFALMPTLTVGHTYLLMVSHFTNTQSGYTLQFTGGTAVITDPLLPRATEAKPNCDGKVIRVKLNKKIKCSSLTAPGTEFTLNPPAATVISAEGDSCNTSFDVDEIILTLSATLPNNNYQLIIQPGGDGNTLLDNCDRPIPNGETVPFVYNPPIPIFADSVGTPGCAPTTLRLYFPKKIYCNTIANDGSDFQVSGGPQSVNVIGAYGECIGGQTEYVTVTLSSPLVQQGTYTLTLKAGVDGTTIIDECGLELPQQSLNFPIADTVNPEFSIQNNLGCRFDTLFFSHSGANQANQWAWTINDQKTSGINAAAILPASSTNTIKLVVGNGVCQDSLTQTLVLDNEVKANFDIPPDICPEDPLEVINTSTGLIDSWRWDFGSLGSSTLETPLPVNLPRNLTRDTDFTLKLFATNNTLGCTDSAVKKIRVFDNCLIAVPTAFTPNGDGLNDYLYPNNAIKAVDLYFAIYNRWGQLVFQSRNWQEKWDGKVKGIPQGSGTYVWMLQYTHRDTGKKVFEKGISVLIR